MQQDARYGGIVNHALGLIIRASKCTLRGNRELCIGVESFVHQDACYEEIGELRTGVDSFVLRGNRELRIAVESFVLLNTKSLFGIMVHRT